ncbi:hypothetical protein QA641_23200 [Bradyrhizobium sp. CB1650]|uniref:hypothetical protein n=1 Tax=Bradyrhizobium sp. CB1650 TaxID=3039153 RepID=UPI002434F5A1|nr:hypothetical protein [Bradyrhizobium sp. CB1650]WGD48566.1 hypothetical protein QA641_23200 [Bradyrhizobium sp. CB1650]
MFHWPSNFALKRLRLRRVWPVFSQLWRDVYASRVVIFSIIVVAYLLHSGQGEELTASLVLVPSSRSWLLFILIAVWAAQCWIWARVAIALDTRDSRTFPEPFPAETLPFLLAMIVFLVALEPFVRAEKTGEMSLIGISVVCLFFGAAKWIRRPDDAGLSTPKSLLSPVGWQRNPLSSVIRFIMDVRSEDRVHFEMWRRAILFSLAWSLTGLLVGAILALQLGRQLGTLGTVFFASTILLPIISIGAISARRTDFPILWGVLLAPFLLPTLYSRVLHTGWTASVVSIALILASGFYVFRRRFVAALMTFVIGGSLAFLAYRDFGARLGVPHEVAALTPDRPVTRCKVGATAGCVTTLPEEIERWVATSGAEPGKSNYVVFVAAAGGGLRAAYWTASILARLTDCIPGFRNRLFAVSGVSGGSLGGALYTALLRDRKTDEEGEAPRCPDRPITILDPPAVKTDMQARLSDFLEQDFLAPVTASLLFRDLPQALIPIQFIPDRAAILANAFDQAWSESCSLRPLGAECASPKQFSQSFFDVKSQEGWTPILFLNGTHEETGKRIITSRVRIDQGNFFDAFDFFDLVGRDVSLSTSVMNSARFPIISPAGALISSSLKPNGHIIDGGFFENNGAVTLQEVVVATLSHLKSKHPDYQWKPLVIEIVNDADEQEVDLARSRNTLFPRPRDEPIQMTSQPYEETEFANQLFSAVTGLYATRTARGILASKMLSEFAVIRSEGEFAQFRLCPHMRPPPPLGWLLTAGSRKAMDQLILGIGRSAYRRQYAGYLDSRAMSEYRNCFDDVQQSLVAVQSYLQ